MKTASITGAAFAAFLFGASPASAVLTASSGHSAIAYHTHTNADAVVSYDWTANGDLYYGTSTSSYTFGGVYRSDSGGVTSIAPADSGLSSGMSTVVSGDYVYFNNSDFSNNQFIYKYGPTGGLASVTQISTTANSSLHVSAGSLYITGAVGFGTSHIYYSGIDASGNLVSNPALDLGEASGFSGPLAFDAAGNLYYAPGFGDTSIYRWSSAEVLSAVSGGNLSVAGHQLLDYGALLTGGGASSMAVDENGVILLTWSNFTDPSALVAFNAEGDGDYLDMETLATSDGRLGQVAIRDGKIYLSENSTIYQVIPEPSALLIAGLSGLLMTTRRKRLA
jgi:hypothetical protein